MIIGTTTGSMGDAAGMLPLGAGDGVILAAWAERARQQKAAESTAGDMKGAFFWLVLLAVGLVGADYALRSSR
jgi:hypothetical protein